MKYYPGRAGGLNHSTLGPIPRGGSLRSDLGVVTYHAPCNGVMVGIGVWKEARPWYLGWETCLQVKGWSLAFRYHWIFLPNLRGAVRNKGGCACEIIF